VAAAEDETGLPASDPVRYGASGLTDAVLQEPEPATEPLSE